MCVRTLMELKFVLNKKSHRQLPYDWDNLYFSSAQMLPNRVTAFLLKLSACVNTQDLHLDTSHYCCFLVPHQITFTLKVGFGVGAWHTI